MLERILMRLPVKYHFRAVTCLVSFDLRLAALFLWMKLFFASLSSREVTFKSCSDALFLSLLRRNFLTAFLTAFLRMRFRVRFASLERLRFFADL